MEKRKFIKDYIEPMFIAVLITLLVRTFVLQAFKIPSGSMEPTLRIGDYLLVNKFIYGIRIPYTDMRLSAYEKPKRGDVIVFIYPVDPSKDFIKRVIGTEGEKIQIVNGKIYINDKQIADPWGHFRKEEPAEYFQGVENFGPVIVPKDSFFVMGDNRDNSADSRFWGFVPLKDVIGKAFIIYFSWNRPAENPFYDVRWSRIGEWIH